MLGKLLYLNLLSRLMKDPQHLLQFVHIATSLGSLCLGNKCCFCFFFSVFRNLQFASVCPTCKVPIPHISFIPATWHVPHLSWRFFSTPTQRAPCFQHQPRPRPKKPKRARRCFWAPLFFRFPNRDSFAPHKKTGSFYGSELNKVFLLIPSRELTSPTLGKGTSSSNMPWV